MANFTYKLTYVTNFTLYMDISRAFESLSLLVDLSINSSISTERRDYCHMLAYWYKEYIRTRSHKDDNHKSYVASRFFEEYESKKKIVRVDLYLPK